jgi:FKBP-type peptidyl-prolyl cis-trans isomerase FkpA
MKQTYFALFLFLAIGLFSCRKEGNDIDIKTYDQQQIDAYIKANNLTNMKRDMTDGDTSGIYYEILAQGAGAPLNYDTPTSLVYSIKTLDGKYAQADTIINHSYNFIGTTTPKGLMIALRNLARFKGTRAKFIIPSRLAYGSTGSGTGSSRLPGNESLEYYVNVINNQDLYDEQVIQKYLTANGLTGYIKTSTGLWYKITKPGTGTVTIVPTSSVTVQYTGSFLNSTYGNGSIFDQYNDQGTTNTGNTFSVDGVIPGWTEGLQKVTAGSQLSLFIPSKLAYGTAGSKDASGNTVIPPNSILHFEMNILTVTN